MNLSESNDRVVTGYRAKMMALLGSVVACIAVSGYAGLNDVYWVPTNASTVAWFDAADAGTVGLSGSSVTNWLDKSDNANHAVRFNSSPTYISSDPLMANMPCIFSSNAGQVGLVTPNLTIKKIYVVAYYGTGVETTFPLWRSLFSGGAGGALPHIMGVSGNSTWQLQMFSSVYKNGSTSSSLSGALPMPATLWKFTSSTNVTCSCYIGIGDSDRGWGGGYSEIIFSDGSEDLATQQKIEGYLAWKWDLEGKLPLDHPYKDQAPNKPPTGTVLVVR